MNNRRSIVAGQSSNTIKAEKCTSYSKGAVEGRRTNLSMMQNVRLIWLNDSIDDNSADSQYALTEIRRVVNRMDTFTDRDQCIDFLTDIHNENVCMIISGTICQNVVPLIHNVAQLHSIFIFCTNKTRHEQWAKDWLKIKCVHTKILPICEALYQVAQQCEQNAISISFIDTSGDISKRNLDQLDPSFMYTQIIKEIMLTITFEQQHIKNFIDYCYKQFDKNDCDLTKIKRFEENYHNEKPIFWYTSESFLYSMLNRALRLMDVNAILKMGFFIVDLYHHIEHLYLQQLGGKNAKKSFAVYRGQGMSKTDFEQLRKTQGGLISFNNFLSTSKDRDVSYAFADSNTDNPDLVGILFVMTIVPSLSSAAFASISSISQFQEEDEVLFAMHTVFRIGDIKSNDEDHRLFQVELTLVRNDDNDLRVLTDYIREDTSQGGEGWYRLGLLLQKMGQFDKAQQLFEILLEEATEESEKAPIYGELGLVKDCQGEYQEAIRFYEKAIEIDKKTLPLDHSRLAAFYNNTGLVYLEMDDCLKALPFFEKALEIQQQSLPSNHPHLAQSYVNLGAVYYRACELSKALSSHQKALEIQQQSLPPNHPDLATSYNSIGAVYYVMGDYSKALSFFEKALNIQQHSLPSNHPDLAVSYNNIGSQYSGMGNHSKALSSHEKALEIRQQSLPPNHPDLASSYNKIGSVYSGMGDHSKALSFHEKALKIQQQSLPPNHTDLLISYRNISKIYESMGEHSKAHSFNERAVDIAVRSSLPPELFLSAYLRFVKQRYHDLEGEGKGEGQS